MRHLLPFLLAALTSTAATLLLVAVPARAHATEEHRWQINADGGDSGDDDGDWNEFDDWGGGDWNGGRGSDWNELPDDIRDSLKDMWDNWDEWMEFIHRPTEPAPESPSSPSKESDPTWERPGRCDDYDASRDWWVYQNWGCG